MTLSLRPSLMFIYSALRRAQGERRCNDSSGIHPFVVMVFPFMVMVHPFVVMVHPFMVMVHPFMVMVHPFMVMVLPFVVMVHPFVVSLSNHEQDMCTSRIVHSTVHCLGDVR
ncbi:MAG: hypothetical protein ACYC9Y_09745 [Candidatus Methylomirabilia bacterium]